MAKTISFNVAFAKMPFEQFEKYMKKRHPEFAGEAKAHYAKICKDAKK